MVTIPHPVSGTILDTDGVTALSGATVTLYNREDESTTTDTTNSSGAYVVDAANLKNSQGVLVVFTDGDNIVVEAVKGNKVIQTKTTISGDEQTVNMTIEYTDALGVVLDQLDTNWQKERTDLIKPVIDRISHRKQLDYSNDDYLLLYEISETDDPFSIGGTQFTEITGISVDVRTANKVTTIQGARPHLMKMRTEVKRILKAALPNPGKPFRILVPRRVKDLSDKSTGLGRVVMDWDISFYGPC